MSALGLVWANLKDRPFTSFLHVVMLALGVAAACALLLFSAQSQERLSRDAADIDLVVGAKGSPLQLVLSSVFHADVPTGNIPLSEYERLRADPRVKQAIPLGLGDSVGGFRIVGAPPAYAALYAEKPVRGRMHAASMEAVLGHEAARALGLDVGDTFVGGHGLTETAHAHEDHPYTVVGVLPRTGAVVDRLVLTPLASVWDVHAHEGPALETRIGGIQSPSLAATPDDHDHDHDHDHESAPHAEEPARETTAVLLQLRSPIAAIQMRREYNQASPFLAARPAEETTRLFALVGQGGDVLAGFALVLIGAAALSVFATLLAALTERRGEIALLRAMGATRGTVVAVLLGQGLAIAALGTALGLLGGHALIEILAQTSPQAAGFGLTGWAWEPLEWAIVAGGLLAGLAAAIVPAVLAYRTDIARTLTEAG